MAATPYDFTAPARQQQESRFSLSRFRASGLGGGLALGTIAIGLLVIGIGWNGMAGGGGEVNGVPNLNAQLPWLISGGILGLALVVFGAAMLVVHNARADRARLEAKLDELVDALSRSGGASATPYPAAPAAGGTPTGVFIAGASAYHDPSCRLVQGRDDVAYVTAGDAEVQKLRACRICKPAESVSR
jgi:hypothetical protein